MESENNPLSNTIRLFRYYKDLTEKAIDQISDSDLHYQPGEDLNSIAILMKHLAGNMKSRWTNFRTEDGEKPWRNRENEFLDDIKSRQQLMEIWEENWQILFDALQSIKESELGKMIYIRNEGATIRDAVNRHLAHVAYHTGQIVLITRTRAGDRWKNLSIPRGKTEEYNRKKFEEPKSSGFYQDRL